MTTSSEAVLFLAGLASTPRVWRPVLAHLPAGYQPVLLDPYVAAGQPLVSLPAMAEHLAGCLSEARISRCHVVAYSMGSLVALYLLQRLPYLAASLCLLSPTGLHPQDVVPPSRLWKPRLDAQRLLFYLTRRSFSPAFLRQQGALLRSLFAADPTAARERLRAQIVALECMAAPPRVVAAPTLVVIAPGDEVVPARQSRQTANLLGAQCVSLAEDARHGYPIEQAKATATLLGDWLAAYPVVEASTQSR